MRQAKLKRAEIASLGSLQQALSLIADTAMAARELGTQVQASADAEIEEHRKQVQRHLARTDLRPKVIFRPHPKNVWTVTFNNLVYSLGPRDPLPVDDDDMAFWWMDPAGLQHSARSMFQALIGIVQDFCNEDVDTGPVVETPATTDLPNSPLP